MSRKNFIGLIALGVAMVLIMSSNVQAQFFCADSAPLFPRLNSWFAPAVQQTPIQNDYYVGVKRSLFNGEDLTGWTDVKGEAPKEGWKVEDGCIYREKNAGDLYAEGKYENFIWEFEFKLADGGNSGVKYRSWNTEGWGLGFEYQIYDDVKDAKNPPRYQTGALYDVIPPREGAPKIKMGEFNKGKIIVLGNHIEHYLNDELVMSVDVGSKEWQEGYAASKFKDMKEFAETTVGRIFLQDHNCKVWFKNLYITELKSVRGGCNYCF